MQLAEDRRYLVETKPLADLICETMAPGLYLLNDNAMDDAAEALQKAGIDIIARRKEKKEPASAYLHTSLYSHLRTEIFKKIEVLFDPSLFYINSSEVSFDDLSKTSTEIKSKFNAALEKMTLSDIERTELSARIDRRLILCESQLKDANVRYEKLEARHLDYAGKQNIAKQAISGASPLEVVWKNKGKDQKIFDVPRSLEKEGNELFLVINGMRIPLAKISLIRRIKKSIFDA
jgi:hypothetical protein